MNSTDREKLDWATDLLKEWQSERAHQAAYEFLAYETLYNESQDVRDEARELLAWAAEHGLS